MSVRFVMRESDETELQPVSSTLEIDRKGALWAWHLGYEHRFEAHSAEHNPFQRHSPHWYFWRHAQTGGDFTYPLSTPYATVQLARKAS
jgi:hypothetical protein